MKVTMCDCCGRVCDVAMEMTFRTYRIGPRPLCEEVVADIEVDICDDCYRGLGYLAEGGDLKMLIDKAEKRRRRR